MNMNILNKYNKKTAETASVLNFLSLPFLAEHAWCFISDALGLIRQSNSRMLDLFTKILYSKPIR